MSAVVRVPSLKFWALTLMGVGGDDGEGLAYQLADCTFRRARRQLVQNGLIDLKDSAAESPWTWNGCEYVVNARGHALVASLKPSAQTLDIRRLFAGTERRFRGRLFVASLYGNYHEYERKVAHYLGLFGSSALRTARGEEFMKYAAKTATAEILADFAGELRPNDVGSSTRTAFRDLLRFVDLDTIATRMGNLRHEWERDYMRDLVERMRDEEAREARWREASRAA